jgi:hypothetical protein
MHCRHGFARLTLVALLVAGWTSPARAACNLAPDVPPPGGPAGTLSSPDRESVKALPYRGRYARISHAVVAPGVTRYIEVGSDPLCKSVTLAQIEAGSAGLAAFFIHQNETRKIDYLHVVGSSGLCEKARAELTSKGVQVSCDTSTDALTKTAKERIRIAYPSKSAAAAGIGGVPKGPIATVVIGIPKGAVAAKFQTSVIDALANLANPVAAAGLGTGSICARLAPTGKEFQERLGGFACIDKLYRDPHGEPCNANSVTLARLDTEYENHCLSEVRDVGVPADFAKHCSKRSGSAWWKGQDCHDQATTLPLAVTDGSCLLVPFDFENVRPSNGDSKRSPRLGGTSALRRHPDIDAAIRIPGTEFVGSVPLDHTAEQRNPAKPGIVVGIEANEVALRLKDKKVDKDNAVLILAPRLLVSVVCKDGDTACQCFDTDATGLVAGCTTDAGCRPLQNDDATCVVKPARYFQCVGGKNYELNGLPCTNGGHCGKNAVCKPATVCVPKGTVWTENWVPPQGAPNCKEDGTCENPDQQQCGLSLFVIPKTKTEIPSEVESGSGDEDGSCKSTRNKTRCKKRCEESGKCVGYLLEAD